MSDEQLISVGGQISNKDRQISEWTTKAVPRTPVYKADLIEAVQS